MSAPRPALRTRRVVAAAALLGAAGLFVAPAALAADSYNNVSVAPNTEVLGIKDGPASNPSGTGDGVGTVDPAGGASSGGSASGGSATGTAVLGVKYGSSSSSLAFTGFEAGAVGVLGAGLIAGGAVLIVSGRRRSLGR